MEELTWPAFGAAVAGLAEVKKVHRRLNDGGKRGGGGVGQSVGGGPEVAMIRSADN